MKKTPRSLFNLFQGRHVMRSHSMKIIAGFLLLASTLFAHQNTLATSSSDALLESEYRYFTQAERVYNNRDYLFVKPYYVSAPEQIPGMDQFHARVKEHSRLQVPAPRLVPIGVGDIQIFVPIYRLGKKVGDNYVERLSIRSQLKRLLGTYLFKGDSEYNSITTLYNTAYAYAQLTPGAIVGKPLNGATLNQDLIWPEYRTIDGEIVMVPVVYLTQETINNYKIKTHKTIFEGGTTTLGNIDIGSNTTLDIRSKFLNVADRLLVNEGGKLSIGNSVERIVVGGNFENLSGRVQADGNLQLIANNIVNKTVVYQFKNQYGTNSRLGQVGTITGNNITLRAINDISLIGGSVAAGGSLTLSADGNIQIVSQQFGNTINTRYSQTSVIDYFGSKLTAVENINLFAGGTIEINGATIESETGFINMMAQLGIYLDTDTRQRTYTYKKGSRVEEDFKFEAIRTVIKAGRGVALHTEMGDINIKAASITSADGAEITAENGGVNLLMSKELDYELEQYTKKSLLTIKTVNIGHNIETAVYPTIVGGAQVNATKGIRVEVGTTKAQQGKQTNLQQLINVGASPAVLNQLKRDIADTEINAIAQIPGLEFIGTIKSNAPVQWDQVVLANDSWHKVDRTLSPAAMAIISIAVAIATNGMGGELLNQAFSQVAANGALGSAASAALTTLASQAAIGVASGKNPGQILKEMTSKESVKQLAISMVTAGAMSKVDSKYFKVADGKKLELLDQAYQAVTHATISAGVSVAVSGGNSRDYLNAFNAALATNALNTIGERITGKIANSPSFEEAQKYIAHAAMGCMVGGLTNKIQDADIENGCISGAGGAAITQFLTSDAVQQKIFEWTQSVKNTSVSFAEVEKKATDLQSMGVNIAKLTSALAAFALKGDVNAAANSAGMVAKANVYRAVNLLEIYAEINGLGISSDPDRTVRMKALYVKQVRDALEAKKVDAAVINSLISKLDSNGVFNAIAKFEDASAGDGHSIDKAADDRQAATFSPDTASGSNQLPAVRVISAPIFDTTQLGLDFFGATNRTVNLLSPEERQVVSIAISAATGGFVKTFINVALDFGKDKVMPESIATAMDEIPTAAATAGVGFLLETDYNTTTNEYTNAQVQPDAYGVKDWVDGLTWIASNITGLPGTRGTNTPVYVQVNNSNGGNTTPSHTGKIVLPTPAELRANFDRYSRSNFDQHLKSPDKINGKYDINRKTGGLSGGHNEQEFLAALDNPRSLTQQQLNDPSFVRNPGDEKGIIIDTKNVTDINGRVVGKEYIYALPATDTQGRIQYNNGSVVYLKENDLPTKTVYDSNIISDSTYNEAAKRASQQAYIDKADDFYNNPTAHTRIVTQHDPQTGLTFTVFFEMAGNMPIIGNAYIK